MQRWSALITVAFIMGLYAPARANYIVAIGDKTIQPGGTDFVDVTIRSVTPGGAPSSDLLSFFGFEFRITSAMSTGTHSLAFTNPQPRGYLTASNYVFFNNSFDVGPPPQTTGNVSQSLGGSPNDTFIGGDQTNNFGDVTVTGNVLLVRLQVTAATLSPPTQGEKYTIRLVPGLNTSFLNNAGEVAYTSSSGAVSITSVPEPNSIVLLVSGGLALLASRQFRRGWA